MADNAGAQAYGTKDDRQNQADFVNRGVQKHATETGERGHDHSGRYTVDHAQCRHANPQPVGPLPTMFLGQSYGTGHLWVTFNGVTGKQRIVLMDFARRKPPMPYGHRRYNISFAGSLHI